MIKKHGFTWFVLYLGVSPTLALRGRAIRYKSSLATQVAGFPLLSLTRITRVHIRYAHALGMRRACVSMVHQHRSEA